MHGIDLFVVVVDGRACWRTARPPSASVTSRTGMETLNCARATPAATKSVSPPRRAAASFNQPVEATGHPARDLRFGTAPRFGFVQGTVTVACASPYRWSQRMLVRWSFPRAIGAALPTQMSPSGMCLAILTSRGRAAEDCRTPGRSALTNALDGAPAYGVRQPSAAFPRPRCPDPRHMPSPTERHPGWETPARFELTWAGTPARIALRHPGMVLGTVAVTTNQALDRTDARAESSTVDERTRWPDSSGVRLPAPGASATSSDGKTP